MVLMPYSTALTLAQRPVISYLLCGLCILVFALQLGTGVTDHLMYYPDSWNPIRMMTASLAHADIFHLLGNLIFFMAFAPALELLVGDRLRYIGFMILISLVVGVAYSVGVLIGSVANLPTLGFSGVVMGVIGLSAFMMPNARIRLFWWFVIGWKIIFVPAWIVAAFYIGFDAWQMLTGENSGGVNLVAHVFGGLAGYAYGYLRLQNRRNEISDELADEVEAMQMEQKYGKTRSEAHRYKKRLDEVEVQKRSQQDKDRFMRGLYQMVKTHRDSDAVLALLERFGANTSMHELETLFDYLEQWGPSRTRLCLGRWIIDTLDREKRYGRAILIIEKCQAISAQFILPDVSRTLFYAAMALDLNKPAVTRNLVKDPQKRYGKLLNPAQCNHLLQKAV